MAFILDQKGQPDRALTLLGAAETIRVTINSAMTPVERREYDQVIAALRTRVDEEKFRQSWDAGRSMDLDHAVDYALGAAAALR